MMGTFKPQSNGPALCDSGDIYSSCITVAPGTNFLLPPNMKPDPTTSHHPVDQQFRRLRSCLRPRMPPVVGRSRDDYVIHSKRGLVSFADAVDRRVIDRLAIQNGDAQWYVKSLLIHVHTVCIHGAIDAATGCWNYRCNSCKKKVVSWIAAPYMR